MSNDTRLIKKYNSRRLYDTMSSTYISFADLGKIISAGYDVKVIDAKTKVDVTQLTLVSYLIENMGVLDFCSQDFLKFIIKAQGGVAEQKVLFSHLFSESFNLGLGLIRHAEDNAFQPKDDGIESI